jgi:hypothetical protein
MPGSFGGTLAGLSPEIPKNEHQTIQNPHPHSFRLDPCQPKENP